MLRDGASAFHGSDAIAGVINIITDQSDHGGLVSARVGQYFEGDSRTSAFRADAGFKLGANGGDLHIAGEADDQKIVIRNSPAPSRCLFYFPLNAAGQQILPAGNLSSSPTLPAGFKPSRASRRPITRSPAACAATIWPAGTGTCRRPAGRDKVDVHVYNSANPTYGLASQKNFYIGRNDYSAWTTNLDIGYDVTDAVNVSLSVNNLCDKKPPKVPAPGLAAYQTYSYTNNGPVGVAGGFYAASIRYKW